MNSRTPVEAVHGFAQNLNDFKFEAASEFLDPKCTYEYWEGNYEGRENVIRIFRFLWEHPIPVFDETVSNFWVEQKSTIECILHFEDELRIDDKWHPSASDYLMTINEGFISDIREKPVPGSAESLREFVMASGRPLQPPERKSTTPDYIP